MQANQRSKKNLLIMPGYQGRMIFLILLVGFVCTVFTGYIYYTYVKGSYDFILPHTTLAADLVAQRYSDLLVFGLALGVATLLITLIMAAWALVVTHRAAGSVYHMRRVVSEIRSGNTAARVRLRDKDEFHELATALNQMLDEFQGRPPTPH